MELNKMKSVLRISAFLIFLPAIISCGGGTTGTGNTPFDAGSISGTVRTFDGKPVGGMQVVVSETGDSDITESDGSFSIALDSAPGEMNLLLTRDSFEKSVTLSIPGGSGNVTVQISVDIVTERAQVESISISVMSTPAPTPLPAASPAPTRSPAPTAGALSNVTVRGVLLDRDGSPVKGADITVVGQKGRERSSDTGKFQIRTSSSDTQVRLLITIGRYKGSVTLKGLPSSFDLLVDVVLELPVSGSAVGGVSTAEARPVRIKSMKVRRQS